MPRPSLAAASLVILATAALATATTTPPAVPRLTVRQLDHASYVELARQWRQHVADHGESATALVNLGMAYDYAGEEDAALQPARRAAELGPDDPAALELLGKLLLTWADDDAAALEVLERCRAIAPDHAPGLTTLAVAYLRRGELDRANDVMQTVFERRLIDRPLQDYAYNMLVGLPEGAVLITAGDNDTFPVKALQAGMGLRTDVAVLNRSLLEDPTYARAVFARRPDIAPQYDIDGHQTRMVDGHPTVLCLALLDGMIARQTAPIYLAATALAPFHGRQYEGRLEGLNLRIGAKGAPGPRAAELLLREYRLDSATDWTYPWSLAPATVTFMRNYVAAMLRTATGGAVDEATRAELIDRAGRIARFHEMGDLVASIEALQGT